MVYNYLLHQHMFCFTLKVEFFGPLCDLVEGLLEVDVGGLEISDRVEVPSLAQLCVHSIHTTRLRCTYAL